MPNITPRKNKNGEITSYTIRVYHGYDSKGKRLKPYTMSYKPAHVQQFVQYLQGDVRQKKDGSIDTDNPKLSQATIRRKLTILQSILRQAVKLEIIPSNPADASRLTLPKVVAPKIEIFSKYAHNSHQEGAGRRSTTEDRIKKQGLSTAESPFYFAYLIVTFYGFFQLWRTNSAQTVFE